MSRYSWDVPLLNFLKRPYQEHSVSMLTRIPSRRHHIRSGLEGSLACLTTDQIIIFDIDETPKAVPRHMEIRVTAKKMVYSPHLRALVVACSLSGNNFNTLEFRRPDTKDRITHLALINPDK